MEFFFTIRLNKKVLNAEVRNFFTILSPNHTTKRQVLSLSLSSHTDNRFNVKRVGRMKISLIQT